ncbi:DUF6356 family protein [uncultured Sphingomonas sp.]|uniref:DUF6356 family protein n=1 Tax=uncultured Sphingomonas sp. TaxID=158754 RepID=UPI0025FEC668|nr:DUF6356 family protein [uncultured Sphingomonas sp.]
MIRRLFLDHPASVGESYRAHFKVAARFGGSMLFGAAAAFVHAIIPALCQRTASSTVKRLHGRLAADPQRDGKRPDFEI